MSLRITPETKVGELLDACPELEEVLARMAPAFRKLKNPVLRRTVAKVATLEQAARIGGVPVREMVIKLREAAGQETDGIGESKGEVAPEERPAWVVESRVRVTVDADELLARNQHPLGRIGQSVAGLAAGEIVCLKSSFRPEPLLRTLAERGLAVHCEKTPAGGHVTYICDIAKEVAEKPSTFGR